MAIPPIPLVTPANVREIARTKLRTWRRETSLNLVEAAMTGRLKPEQYSKVQPYVAEPNQHTLRSGNQTQQWIGHKGSLYTVTVGILDNASVLGVIDSRKIGGIVDEQRWTIVAPTGSLLNDETVETSLRREWEEESRIRPNELYVTGNHPDPILPARHEGIFCRTGLVLCSSPYQETSEPRDRSEPLFLCRFTLDDWMQMICTGGYLEEGTVIATMRAMCFHDGLFNAYRAVRDSIRPNTIK